MSNMYCWPDGSEKDSFGKFFNSGRAQPGDTVWLHGGVYDVGFRVQGPSIAGMPDKPIIFRAMPGERAEIRGTLHVVYANTWLWGLDISNVQNANIGDGVCIAGDGIRLINNIIHDCPKCAVHAHYEAADFEANGNVLMNNKHGFWFGGKTSKDHPARFTGNVVFGNTHHGHHIWREETNGGLIEGIHIDREMDFGNANPILLGGDVSTKHVSIKNSLMFHVKDGRQPVRGTDIGYCGHDCEHIEVNNNMFFGGRHALNVRGCTKHLKVRNNKFWSSYEDSEHVLALEYQYGRTPKDGEAHDGTMDVDENEYYSNGEFNLDEWKKKGFDKRSTFKHGRKQEKGGDRPSGAQFFRSTCDYNTSRTFVAVVNWDEHDVVAYDASAFLKVGDAYKVHNVQDIFGAPVAEGVYDTQMVLPMTGHRYCPEFAAFLVEKVSL